DHRSTVISLQKLIVREVANEERGLFLITAGTERPEMVEVLASCKEERNAWMSVIQDTMHCIEKEEDEGVPSESEEDRRQQENRAKEIRGLFLITAGTERPEMVEVLASCKEERNAWMSVIQDTMHCIEKEEDEGVPSESEEDRRQQENRAKEIRELLRRKDEQIVSLLEEKVHIFKDLCDCNPALDE
ncbi:hypothetical protein CRUP_018004, partial [Coryphaenoides rupestris]